MLYGFGAYSIIVGRVVTDSQETGKPLIHTWSISKKWWSGGDHLFLEGSHSKSRAKLFTPKVMDSYFTTGICGAVASRRF